MEKSERQPKKLNFKKSALFASALALGATGCGPADATPMPRPEGNEFFSVAIGEKQMFDAKKGDIVVGDIVVGPIGTTIEQFQKDAKAFQQNTPINNDPNIVELYDTTQHKNPNKNNEDTGLITVMQEDGRVYAEWEAEVVGNYPSDKIETYTQYRGTQMEKRSGCNGTCKDGIDVIPWTGSNTVPQGDLK